MLSIEQPANMRHAQCLAIFLSLLLIGNALASDEWALKDMKGKTHTLSAYQGKWVLVNFWATWCSPCVAEIPEFNSLQQAHPDELVIIGIAESYRTRQEVMDFVHDKKIVYPVVLGNEDTAGDFGGLDGTPTSFLYSPSGKLVDRHEGFMTQADIERKLH